MILIGEIPRERENADVKEIAVQTWKGERVMNSTTNGKKLKQSQIESLKILLTINRKNHSTEINFYLNEEWRE